MEKIKGIIFHLDQWPALSCLSDEQLGRLIRHLCKWFFDDCGDDRKEELLVDTDIRPTFLFMRSLIKADSKKYQQTCERNKRNIMKRWQKNTNDTTVDFEYHTNTNTNTNTSTNTNTKTNTSTSTNGRRKSSSSSVISEKAANEEDEEEEEDSLVFEKAEKQWLPWFNKLIDDNASAIPKMRKMTMDRAKAMKSLADKYGNDALLEVLRRAAQNSFLNGRSKRSNFVANIDWLLKEENFMKVYENKFYNK